uniref:Fcf2 pre-rRNA processing C-terminal domain-containing protein n=1 Tax=Strombidium rassoulzadegani TaxID=1082188 RepID=A0A7S3CRG7_9SPIT|mmetsp:Transcript_5046/g.8598  ORF Transcript_5046/g.8598 Transcript_5046/m.8598 type:complete len:130 (+) Transcript_5046:922-1311(+)
MKKVELTEEVKADLRAIKLRNQIFKDRFYKTSEFKKLPQYFQIGTVVDDPRVEGGNADRLTKKQRKGTIAEQFLMDDQHNGFSKRKYESLNDKRRRMGDKKRNMKVNKKKVEKTKVQSKKISKGRSKNK